MLKKNQQPKTKKMIFIKKQTTTKKLQYITFVYKCLLLKELVDEIKKFKFADDVF